MENSKQHLTTTDPVFQILWDLGSIENHLTVVLQVIEANRHLFKPNEVDLIVRRLSRLGLMSIELQGRFL
jgi:hypothetical protein